MSVINDDKAEIAIFFKKGWQSTNFTFLRKYNIFNFLAILDLKWMNYLESRVISLSISVQFKHLSVLV